MGVFGLFDPPECKQAEDCLARSQPAEAARVLLASKHRHHRRVQQLLLEAGARLVELAKTLVENPQHPHLEAAAEMIDLASRCMHLDGPALALQQQIQQFLHQRQQADAFQAQLLRQAEQLEQAGRIRAALETLAPLGELSQATALRLRLQQRLETYRRHQKAIETCLSQGQVHAAHRHWQEAKKLCPHEPELAEWAGRIAQALAAPSSTSLLSAVSPQTAPGDRTTGSGPIAPLCRRSQEFLLADWALVLSSGEVCLGVPRSEGVQIPLLGRLHRRHALLVQDGQGWQLIPLADNRGNPCPVWLNGVLILGPERLRPGDKIAVGGANPAGGSYWEFTLPVPGSATAVLESAPGNQNLISVGGYRLPRAVLLADTLVIGSTRPAHLVLADLPCQRIVFRWQPEGLCWQVEGGAGRLEIPGQTLDQADSRLYLPSRLVVESALDEAELLGRAAAGAAPETQLTLEIKTP